MDYNPLASELEVLERQADRLNDQLASCLKDLEWSSAFDAAAEGKKAKRLKRTLTDSSTEADRAANAVSAERQKTSDLERDAEWSWNPGDWFSGRRSEAKGRLESNRSRVRDLESQRIDVDRRVAQTRSSLDESERQIEKFRNLDRAALEGEISKLRAAIASKQLALENLRRRKTQIDHVLAPQIAMLQDLKRQERDAQRTVEEAHALERRMDTAANSYERKLLHDECSGRFGKSSPRAATREQERAQDLIEREIGKVKRRIGQDAGRASRESSRALPEHEEHLRSIRQWIALAQIEAWLYENANSTSPDITAASADAAAFRRRLTAPRRSTTQR